MCQGERQASCAKQDRASPRQLIPDSSGYHKIILGSGGLVVEQDERTGSEPNCAAVHSLQFSRGFHRAKVAPDGLLRDA